MTAVETDRLQALSDQLRSLDKVVVAFSGGVDSALLAYVAHQTLGSDNAIAVTADSPSLARDELADCERLASEWNLNWRTVVTNEMADPQYEANDGMRCARCKTALMDELQPVADEVQATVVLGVNTDDLGDYRPGQKAAAEQGAVFPFVQANLSKQDVRELSRRLGLRTWDKPAAACLSSRVPYGTPVTLGTLTAVEKAESALRRMGFASLRVRHYDDTARLEVPVEQLPAVIEQREQVVDSIKKAGYRYVTLDLEGLRSGNLNQALKL